MNVRNWRLSTWVHVGSAIALVVPTLGFFLWLLVGVITEMPPSPKTIELALAVWLYCISLLALLNSFIIAHRFGTALGTKLKTVKYKFATSVGIVAVSGAVFLVFFLPIKEYLPKLTQEWVGILWAWLAFRAVSVVMPSPASTKQAS